MNTKLYRKCRLYRLLFIAEVQERQRKALYRKMMQLRRRALKLLKDDFDREVKAGNYGEALSSAQYYFQLKQTELHYEN